MYGDSATSSLVTGEGTEYMKSIRGGTDCGALVNTGGNGSLVLDVDAIVPKDF